jgi:hypothetical protein
MGPKRRDFMKKYHAARNIYDESNIRTAAQERASAPSEDEIRQRAFEIHVTRGGTHGSDVDDWLQAERELNGKYNSTTKSPQTGTDDNIGGPSFT